MIFIFKKEVFPAFTKGQERTKECQAPKPILNLKIGGVQQTLQPRNIDETEEHQQLDADPDEHHRISKRVDLPDIETPIPTYPYVHELAKH